MIEVKPEAASCWGSTMADHTKVDSDIKQESEMRRTDRDHQAPCAELTASPPAGGFSAAPNVCLAPAGPSDGLCKPESKSPSLTDLRTPQQQPSLQSELYLSSLNQKVSSEKTCSYFQQKIPTWRVSEEFAFFVHLESHKDCMIKLWGLQIHHLSGKLQKYMMQASDRRKVRFSEQQVGE